MQHSNIRLSRRGLALLSFFLLTGCGGGDTEREQATPLVSLNGDYTRVETGYDDSAPHSLDAIVLQPIYRGSAPSQSSSLLSTWRERYNFPPPSRYEVQLLRFDDSDGGPARTTGLPLLAIRYNATAASQPFEIGESSETGWEFQKRNPADDLFTPGSVYIIRIRTAEGVTPVETREQAVLTPIAGLSSDGTTNKESVSPEVVGGRTGIDVLAANTLGFTALNGAVFVPRSAALELTYYNSANTPPEQFDVLLRRYKEGRNGERSFSNTGQPITITPINRYQWQVRRKGNALLDPYAVYVLEIRGKGIEGAPKVIRSIFISGAE